MRFFRRSLLLLSFALLAVFFVRGSSAQSEKNAMGIRIMENLPGISAADWYAKQCADRIFTKCGTPKPLIVDGYDGVRDGNTVYVNAANVLLNADGSARLYTNIFIISLATNADATGTEIFQQVSKNLKFNTNISEDDTRGQLRRDTRRRATLQSMRRILTNYYDINRCSTTVTRACLTKDHCPAGETCGNFYPDLRAGSYVRGISFSSWPSWQETLGKAFGTTLPPDQGRPYKVIRDGKETIEWRNFVGCGTPYNPQTCWDERQAKMSCPVSAYVYLYRFTSAGTNTSASAGFTTSYETPYFKSAWPADSHDPATWVGTFCSSRQGSASQDADLDGILDSLDLCPNDNDPNPEQADRDRDAIGDACDTCPLDDKNDADRDGLCADRDACPTVPNTGRDTDGDGVDDACDSQFCGNARKDVGEECDPTDTTKAGVGANQECRIDCTLKNLTYCGDGVVQTLNEKGGQEECERNQQQSATSCTLANGYKGVQSGRSCVAATCKWGAAAPCNATESCGDQVKNGTEQCDGTSGVGANQQCKADCTLKNLTYCGDGTVQKPNESGFQEECEGGSASEPCTAAGGYSGTRTRSCAACRWGQWSACTATQSCGDGRKNGTEACDPADTTKAGVGPHQVCTPQCTVRTVAYCGDGVKQTPNEEGVQEQCDVTSGVGTNQRCLADCTLKNLTYCGDGRIQNPNDSGVREQCDLTAGVGARQRCTTSCTLETVNICGDGVKDGTEQCDRIGTTVDLGSPVPTCTSLGWGSQGAVNCDPDSCRYYGGGCIKGDLSPGDIRIKVIWPSVMKDLDSHFIVPAPLGEVPKIGSLIFQGKVFHNYKGSVFSAPFAWLSWDDTGGNKGETPGTGMEIVTFTKHSGAYYSGTYKFYVYNFSFGERGEGAAFKGQDAIVEVYVYDSGSPRNEKKLKPYTTKMLSTNGNYWYVFDFNNGVITDRNIIQSVAPSP